MRLRLAVAPHEAEPFLLDSLGKAHGQATLYGAGLACPRLRRLEEALTMFRQAQTSARQLEDTHHEALPAT